MQTCVFQVASTFQHDPAVVASVSSQWSWGNVKKPVYVADRLRNEHEVPDAQF